MSNFFTHPSDGSNYQISSSANSPLGEAPRLPLPPSHFNLQYGEPSLVDADASVLEAFSSGRFPAFEASSSNSVLHPAQLSDVAKAALKADGEQLEREFLESDVWREIIQCGAGLVAEEEQVGLPPHIQYHGPVFAPEYTAGLDAESPSDEFWQLNEPYVPAATSLSSAVPREPPSFPSPSLDTSSPQLAILTPPSGIPLERHESEHYTILPGEGSKIRVICTYCHVTMMRDSYRKHYETCLKCRKARNLKEIAPDEGFTCRFCPYKNMRMDVLNKHIRLVHPTTNASATVTDKLSKKRKAPKSSPEAGPGQSNQTAQSYPAGTSQLSAFPLTPDFNFMAQIPSDYAWNYPPIPFWEPPQPPPVLPRPSAVGPIRTQAARIQRHAPYPSAPPPSHPFAGPSTEAAGGDGLNRGAPLAQAPATTEFLAHFQPPIDWNFDDFLL